MDIQDIARNYARMSDDDIIRISTTEASGLRPEVFGIIENEIQKRNLNPNLLKSIIVQNQSYSNEIIEHYSSVLRDLPCPICQKTQEKLNGTVSHYMKSFVFFSTYDTEITIACPDCLDNKNNDAILSTALFGWWGIPTGLFRTPFCIYKNIKAKKEHRLNIPNDTLLSFTLKNIGEIELYKNDNTELKNLIKPKAF
jgi:hypothetical protein